MKNVMMFSEEDINQMKDEVEGENAASGDEEQPEEE